MTRIEIIEKELLALMAETRTDEFPVCCIGATSSHYRGGPPYVTWDAQTINTENSRCGKTGHDAIKVLAGLRSQYMDLREPTPAEKALLKRSQAAALLMEAEALEAA